jgi:cellulose synthase/poly-beta-1,6-N-acetylglucosamine synthase-like glycosyltransferase
MPLPDYALGMELKSRGYKATYLNQYIAVGEAPEEARNIFQQRSRWTKGHYQVSGEWRVECPLSIIRIKVWSLNVLPETWIHHRVDFMVCILIFGLISFIHINMQVYFSGVNPLLNFDLPFFQRLWYTYAAWAPFCTIVTVPCE